MLLELVKTLVHKITVMTKSFQPSQLSFGLCHYLFAELWTVEDLLAEDDITDKVPLQRLRHLGSKPTLAASH